MKRIANIFLVAVLFLATSCGFNKLKEEGNVFMDALKNSDAEKSFALLDTSIQREVGGMEGWKAWIEFRKPLKWNFTGFEVKEGGSGQLTGNADFSTGQNLKVELNFTKLNDSWKIIGIDFKE